MSDQQEDSNASVSRIRKMWQANAVVQPQPTPTPPKSFNRFNKPKEDTAQPTEERKEVKRWTPLKSGTDKKQEEPTQPSQSTQPSQTQSDPQPASTQSTTSPAAAQPEEQPNQPTHSITPPAQPQPEQTQSQSTQLEQEAQLIHPEQPTQPAQPEQAVQPEQPAQPTQPQQLPEKEKAPEANTDLKTNGDLTPGTKNQPDIRVEANTKAKGVEESISDTESKADIVVPATVITKPTLPDDTHSEKSDTDKTLGLNLSTIPKTPSDGQINDGSQEKQPSPSTTSERTPTTKRPKTTRGSTVTSTENSTRVPKTARPSKTDAPSTPTTTVSTEPKTRPKAGTVSLPSTPVVTEDKIDSTSGTSDSASVESKVKRKQSAQARAARVKKSESNKRTSRVKGELDSDMASSGLSVSEDTSVSESEDTSGTGTGKPREKDLEERLRILDAENRRLKEELDKKDQTIKILEARLSKYMDGGSLGSASASSSLSSSLAAAVQPPALPSSISSVSSSSLLASAALLASSSSITKKNDLFDADIATLPRTFSPALARKSDLSHRDKLILEILTTEQSYVLGLRLMVNVYIKGLQKAAESGKFDASAISNIFPNTEQILLINEQFCSELEERLNKWMEEGQDQVIGDILAKKAPTLKPYCRYGSCYEESLIKIEDLKQSNSAFRKALEELDKVVFDNYQLSLRDYFITPVQRIPRYCLLIRDLIKQTTEKHPDFHFLQDAQIEMGKIASAVNENIRASENSRNLMKILERGGGFERLLKNPSPLVGVRTLIKAGDISGLVDLYDVKKGAKKKAEIVLFSDIIVGGNFVGKKVLAQDYFQPTKILWLEQNVKENVLSQVEDRSAFSNAFVMKGPETKWLLGFGNLADKKNWIEAIINTFDDDTKQNLEEGYRKGAYEFRNQWKYDGQWLNGELHGSGKLTCEDILFEGYWHGPNKAGYGIVKRLTNSSEESSTLPGSSSSTYYPASSLAPGAVIETGWKITQQGVELSKLSELWSQTELSDYDWKLMLTGAEIIKLSPNTKFIEQGKPNSKLFRVKTGKIRVEKGVTPDVPKKVLVTLGAGTVVGDSSVISSLSAASADVLSDTEVELEAISITILFGLFQSNPGLSMRFYRQMAVKNANQIKTLQGPSKKEKGRKSKAPLEKKLSLAGSSAKEEAAEVSRKFGLPSNEVLLKSADCTFKSVINKIGTLYLFQNNLCFESNVFGSKSADVYPLKSINNIEAKKGNLKIQIKSKKFIFSQVSESENFVELLMTLWNEMQKKTGDGKEKDKKTDKTRSVKKRDTETKDNSVEMTTSDWDLLFAGASTVKYKTGDTIVQEGKEHQRIYQIAQGSCVIKKQTTEGEATLASLESGALFGEMTFLEKGKATASVIAASTVTVYILEGWYINTLFVDYPNLAGKFYSYLATILSQRLRDREESLAQQQQQQEQESAKDD